MIKTSLDLDGVICDFYGPYVRRFGVPRTGSDITKKVHRVLRKDSGFWLTLPVINRPDFPVGQYTTARCIPKPWIKKYLAQNGMPKAPVYQLYSYHTSKVPKIRMGGCGMHIDDSLRVFADCNLHGVPCLLMDSPANRAWEHAGRIHSLDKEEIRRCYETFMERVFPDFRSYWDETVRRYPSVLEDS